MARFLLFALIAFAAWLLLKRSAGTGAGVRPAPPSPPPAEPPLRAEAIQPCAHCGLHVPAADAIYQDTAQGRLPYCSEEHRRLGPRPPQ